MPKHSTPTIPTFIINLESSVARKEQTLSQLPVDQFQIEIVPAVNGKELSQEYIDANCDANAIAEHPTWLTPGALGCSLSHLEVYKRIVERNLSHALVLEDDNLYPSNLAEICLAVTSKMTTNEVSLLYYESFEKCAFSERSARPLFGDFSLVRPLDESKPITTGAYLITLEAARRLSEFILPVRVAADTWTYFIASGVLKDFSCIYPLAVQDANFKSEIGYLPAKNLIGQMSTLVDRYNIPILNPWLKKRRMKLRADRLHFDVVDEEDYRNISS